MLSWAVLRPSGALSAAPALSTAQPQPLPLGRWDPLQLLSVPSWPGHGCAGHRDDGGEPGLPQLELNSWVFVLRVHQTTGHKSHLCRQKQPRQLIGALQLILV